MIMKMQFNVEGNNLMGKFPSLSNLKRPPCHLSNH